MQDTACVAIGIARGPAPSLFELSFFSPVMIFLSCGQNVTSHGAKTEGALAQGQEQIEQEFAAQRLEAREPAVCTKEELFCGSADKEMGGTLKSASLLGWRDSSMVKALIAQREDWSLDPQISHKHWAGMVACLEFQLCEGKNRIPGVAGYLG